MPIALAAVFGLAHSAPAVAGTATTLGGLQYMAAPGESNHVTFSRNGAGTDVFVDATAVVVAGTGCTQVNQHEADCTPGFGMDGLQANLGDGNDSITFSDLATAHVDGGDGDDTITTGTNVCIDDLHGGAGNDTITAAGLGTCGPGDSLYGDDGNDVLTVGHGSGNTLFGGNGADRLNGGPGTDTLEGGTGPDVLNGGGGAEDIADYSSRTIGVTVTLDGVANDGEPGEGDNVAADVEYLIGGSGDDSLTGSASPNHLEGREGNDTLVGGGGNDQLTGANGNDSIAAGAGDDFITAGAGNDTETGGDGNDLFDQSDTGDDNLDGGAGDDRIASSSVDGSDVLNGGGGSDTVEFLYRTGAVSVTLDGVADDGQPGENDNIEPDVENLIGTGYGDTFVGSAAANNLDGQDGSDTISGGGGDDVVNAGWGTGADVLNGGPGNDVLKGTGQAGILHGDAGTDTADYSSYQYGLNVSLDGLANDGPPPLASDNVESDVENLTTGEGVDTLTGDAGSNVLDGGLGADVLHGGAGVDVVSYASRSTPIYAEVGVAPQFQENEDTIGDDIEGVRGGAGDDTLIGNGGANLLDGGPGDDMLDGRGGPDTLLGGAGQHDLVDYSARTKPLSVSLDGVANDGESGEGDNAGADVEDIVGGSAGDTLTGNASDNRFDGGAGADTISGRAGEDTVNYSSRNGAVGIYLDGTPTSGNASDGPRGHRDRLIELEDAIGGTVGDVLVGNSSRNVLDGQEGDDTLDGGPGPDVLIGGLDDDVVDYSRRSTGVSVDLDGSPSSGNAADGHAGARDRVSADVEGIIGTVGSDTLIGSNKDNVFLGGPGADRFSGLGGLDLVVYAERRKPVKVSLDGAANDGQRNERDNVHRDVEGVLGGSAGDTLTGSAGGNVLVGGPGADSLNGLRGVDLLLGGAGADVLTGGRGIDGLEAGPGRDRVLSRDRFVDLVSCGSGRDAVTADAVDSVKRDCEKVDRGRGKNGHAVMREFGLSSAPAVVEQMRWWDSVATRFADPPLTARTPR